MSPTKSARKKRGAALNSSPVAPAAKIWRATDLDSYDGPLLLDTHVWIWHLTGDAMHLSPSVVSLLDRVGSTSGLRVSDISYWEVAVKAAKKKLTLSVDAAIWLQRAERAPGIRFLPLERDVLLLSTRLSGTAHNDPADRMLIASAQINNIPLVTADKLIIDYARSVPGTPVVDVRV
ncbi:MAG: type II toxin-antitoxin system VapC family toxin [Gemmatimonadaceae bacterium]